ncbi:SDR family oxidoreductase [Burkholderia glumae]|uniref:UDP-glucose 4-epimerase family protein n=1 Tax=Burkholderia glumae TaxID=337 RepID=UPI000F5E0D18|nr:SDR family oxidoreductase [Burkholderia glumae]MCQ0029449.1 SDR family oxidoreductase [Burkholderia glumae]MCQ0035915.1 SDR family oxidoreductase [Burkholderia glumae]QJW78406.1 SDR family oxidoreductase [Burkholderia glumae]RQZ73716.1 NAD-dependent epimerase/dehydratase family protein [Burkholderia glumae]UVS83523.1 SDR family oxidoreductase [Burkholderia glumae]
MIAVTGAHGFVGQAVLRRLAGAGLEAAGIVRRAGAVPIAREWAFDATDFAGIGAAWPTWLRCDVVIHLAARVHVMDDHEANPLTAYRRTNVEGTLRVAQAAREIGARRFVYVSSIKAVGESSSGRPPLGERDAPRPLDPYGRSKREAELALAEFGARTGMDIVIVRPPLVYGPGVRANFLRLMDAVSRRVPLPLGAIEARRSLVFVDNLADALVRCAIDAPAAGQLFHVADAHDPGVAELVRLIGEALEIRPRLIPVPESWLRAAGRLIGRSAQVDRLAGELRLDTRHIQSVLGWRPPFTLEAGLRETARWYRDTH